MFNSNLLFPCPSFFFLGRYRFFLNLTFLVESVFSFEGVFSPFLLFVFFHKFPPQESYGRQSHFLADKVVKPDETLIELNMLSSLL